MPGNRSSWRRDSRMKKFLVAVLAAAFGTTLIAANPHYKKGGQPVCTIEGDTASCGTGLVAGLGNADVRVTVSLGAVADTFCHNPGNSNIVPGQNPAEATGSTSVDLSADQIKNGTLTLPAISTTVTVPVPTAEGADCPNNNWTVTLGPVVYGPGVYTFEQPPGTPIAKLSFEF